MRIGDELGGPTLDEPFTLQAELAADYDEEAIRERRWHDLIVDCRLFAEREGWDAVLRCVADAMKDAR